MALVNDVERLLEPNQGQTALMANGVAHGGGRVLAPACLGYQRIRFHPMTTHGELDATIQAASACWDHLAAFARRSYHLSGPGAVLVLAEDLRRVAGQEADPEDLTLNYFARDDIPPGDDFRSLMDTYDPGAQVMLMIGGGDEEQVLVLEAADGVRVRPDSFD